MQPAAITPDEARTIRSADVFAAALVSGAEPGLLDLIRESFASSRAIHDAPEELQSLLAGVTVTELPDGDLRHHQRQVIELLGEAQRILAAKAPELLEPFRDLVRTNCHNVAHAARGTSRAEESVLTAIEHALAAGGDAATPTAPVGSWPR